MNLTIEALHRQYEKGTLTPRQLMETLRDGCGQADPAIWVHRLTEAELAPYLDRLDTADMAELPLYGIPFAIKDNIDLAGIPTTAACPEYSYTPQVSAFVVDQLIAAGAVPVGKTNLDQFATGLVGTRSPYGACKNSFDPDYISGGSSSGSAVAVATGLCTFALGTDTAGSGRVPAALNNILGLKPSRGLVSTRGVVPACRSLDCVSIFALCAADAQRVMQTAAVFDEADAYARGKLGGQAGNPSVDGFTFGVPQAGQLEFFGNREYQAGFENAVRMLTDLGGRAVTIDYAPFLEAASLLYDGPWVEERTLAVGGFLKANPDAGFPVTRQIICKETSASAMDLFEAMYRLKALKCTTDRIMAGVDVLVTPTCGTCYTIAQETADPIALNTTLGYYTNYMNLLDYCGLAVPAGMGGRLPFGVTLAGTAFSENFLLRLGHRLHRQTGLAMGTGSDLPPDQSPAEADALIPLAVCGAHLKGLPLHHQLVDLKARLVNQTRTAASYRMIALDTTPPKPGLIRDPDKGQSLEVEVYALDARAFGQFVAQIPHPLGIGKIELVDGTWVPGFIAEPVVVDQGKEITRFGGWRAYLKSV